MPLNMFSMQQKLLILFIYQHQFLCHATWTTRTAAATEAALSPAISSSSSSDTSEATPSSTLLPSVATTFMPLRNTTTTTKSKLASASPSKVMTTTTTPISTISTSTTTTPPPQATTPLVVVVSSSEATLLTRNLNPTIIKHSERMQLRQYFGAALKSNRNRKTGKNNIGNPGLTSSSTIESNDRNENNRDGDDDDGDEDVKHRIKIVSLHTNCSRDLFEMHIDLNRGFHGLLYAKDFPLECRTRGTSHSKITLRLPTSGCGVRAEPLSDGNMELSVRIMLQMEQKLRQSSDILKTVHCKLPLNAMGMTVTSKENNKQRHNNYRNGRGHNLNGARRKYKSKKLQEPQTEEESTTPTTPRVRIWLELGDRDGSGVVEVGQETTLTVRSIVPGRMGVRVVECAALDGLGESTQQLLDDRGCPIDEQVMPALHTTFKPAEEGWSKQNEDDLVEKIFTATFPAFKFPDRERLHVSCGVQLCKGPCPEINCRSSEQLVLSTDKHLARIEVFNSLAVTAPQIEVDRLRYDRRYNMSVEEYPPFIRQLHMEGTLCMSVSKLAISFCILGIIFLIAVIVAIYSLIRSRRRTVCDPNALTSNASRIHRAEVCTSMFSSSSGDSTHTARFGSKLLIPYYPANTLPYGRVY